MCLSCLNPFSSLLFTILSSFVLILNYIGLYEPSHRNPHKKQDMLKHAEQQCGVNWRVLDIRLLLLSSPYTCKMQFQFWFYRMYNISFRLLFLLCGSKYWNRYGGLLVMQHSNVLSIGSLITFQLYWIAINFSYESLTKTAAAFTKAGNTWLQYLFPSYLLPSPFLYFYNNYRGCSGAYSPTSGVQTRHWSSHRRYMPWYFRRYLFLIFPFLLSPLPLLFVFLFLIILTELKYRTTKRDLLLSNETVTNHLERTEPSYLLNLLLFTNKKYKTE